MHLIFFPFFVFVYYFSYSRIHFSFLFHILQGAAEIPFLSWSPIWQTEFNIMSTAFFFFGLVPGNAIWTDETCLARIWRSFKYRGCIFYLNTQRSVKCLVHKLYLISFFKFHFRIDTIHWIDLKLQCISDTSCLLKKGHPAKTLCPIDPVLFVFRNELGWRNRIHEQLCCITEEMQDFLSRNVNIYVLAERTEPPLWTG